jgi:glycerol dehydrogenase
MLTIKTPNTYLNAPGIIGEAGKHIVAYGTHPLIIGSKTALEVVGDSFFQSLQENGIDASNVYTFSGYPSENQFNHYAEIARKSGADVIIGIGGGRTLDTAKATGDILSLPVVTIPTIAATCAAWAAVTIQYDDEGAYVTARWNKQTARLIIADTRILLTAPTRYLYAGIVDTFAKYYETRPAFEHDPHNTTTKLGLYGSEIAFENLKIETVQALREAKKDVFGKAAIDVVDAIIYLAGYVGSFTEASAYRSSFAHPFYHCSTRLANTRHLLHGEKVAFGIVAQLYLENKPEEEIVEAVKLFDAFHAAFTLEDLGIKENLEQDLKFLGRDIPQAFPSVLNDEKKIIAALKAADAIVARERGNVACR